MITIEITVKTFYTAYSISYYSYKKLEVWGNVLMNLCKYLLHIYNNAWGIGE